MLRFVRESFQGRSGLYHSLWIKISDGNYVPQREMMFVKSSDMVGERALCQCSTNTDWWRTWCGLTDVMHLLLVVLTLTWRLCMYEHPSWWASPGECRFVLLLTLFHFPWDMKQALWAPRHKLALWSTPSTSQGSDKRIKVTQRSGRTHCLVVVKICQHQG